MGWSGRDRARRWRYRRTQSARRYFGNPGRRVWQSVDDRNPTEYASAAEALRLMVLRGDGLTTTSLEILTGGEIGIRLLEQRTVLLTEPMPVQPGADSARPAVFDDADVARAETGELELRPGEELLIRRVSLTDPGARCTRLRKSSPSLTGSPPPSQCCSLRRRRRSARRSSPTASRSRGSFGVGVGTGLGGSRRCSGRRLRRRPSWQAGPTGWWPARPMSRWRWSPSGSRHGCSHTPSRRRWPPHPPRTPSPAGADSIAP